MKQDSTRQPISKQHSMRKNNTGPCEIKPYLIFGHYPPHAPPPPPYLGDRLGQMSWLVKCARRGGAAGPVVFVQFYDTHHPSYQQNCIPYWLH